MAKYIPLSQRPGYVPTAESERASAARLGKSKEAKERKAAIANKAASDMLHDTIKDVKGKRGSKQQPSPELARAGKSTESRAKSDANLVPGAANRRGSQSVTADGTGHAVRDPEVLDRILNCIQLRKGGASYRNIAANLGTTERIARDYVVEEMQRLTEEIQEAAKEHRQLQLERLNELILGYWPRRTDPKYGGMILALMQKQDALLGIVSEKIDLKVTQSEFAAMPQEELDNFLNVRMKAITKPEPRKAVSENKE